MDTVYFDDCGVGMMESDVWAWITQDIYKGWTFDDIVGGSDAFVDVLVYRRLKSRYEELIKRMNDE